ncbi:retrovirus-related pol polyprotein from transposon TNT 1-94 [Tanacetum coccineum]
MTNARIFHMDLSGPYAVLSYGGNPYNTLCHKVDDYSRKIEESLNVTFDETPPPSKTSPLVDDDLDEEEAIRKIKKKNLENVVEDETLEIDEIVNIKESRNNPLENNVNEALGDESWIVAMQEELNQFIANDVWELVAQGYNQQEGINYDETYAPVARLESIRILLVYACALDFKLFQMDVKSAFLNGFINEEIYMAQPPGFIDFKKLYHVYKLKKALYGLKQAPKVMLNFEDSTITYTEVSSPFADLSDIGSPGVDGSPVMPKDPYAYVVAAFQAPSSPDYVPGPEEPEQAPPPPVYVPYVPRIENLVD